MHRWIFEHMHRMPPGCYKARTGTGVSPVCGFAMNRPPVYPGGGTRLSAGGMACKVKPTPAMLRDPARLPVDDGTIPDRKPGIAPS